MPEDLVKKAVRQKRYLQRSGYGRKYYLAHREILLEKDRQRSRESRHVCWRKQYEGRQAWLNSLKDVPCFDCGIKYPMYCMEFDHARGTKQFVITKSVMIKRSRLEEELAKCDVVCANCHCIRTYNRNQNKKAGNQETI